MQKFNTIVADPPWEIMRPTGWGRKDLNHRPQNYPTMDIAEIRNLRVSDFAGNPSYLFLWTVNKFVEESYGVARSWGLSPTTLLTWCKRPHGMGPGGHFASTTEFILYARCGSSSEFGRKRIHNSSWFTWPRRSQSEKPDEFQDLIENHFPPPFLELFARRRRLGWFAWGNEVQSDKELEALTSHKRGG